MMDVRFAFNTVDDQGVCVCVCVCVCVGGCVGGCVCVCVCTNTLPPFPLIIIIRAKASPQNTFCLNVVNDPIDGLSITTLPE